MDPEIPAPDAPTVSASVHAGPSAFPAVPCVPVDVALDPELVSALAGRLEELAGEAGAEQPGPRMIGPPTPAALAAVETPGARSAAALAMDRLARVCSDYAAGSALHTCGMAIDSELGWLRREIAAVGSSVSLGVRALVDADEAGADGVGAAGRGERPAA